jgi:hypothetical protein
VTSLELSRAFFEAATLPLIVAGAAHLAGAVLDNFRPTFFTPLDEELRLTMATTGGLRFREMFPPRGGASPSFWRLWLGFNMTHGLGVAGFGAVCLLAAWHDYAMVVATPGLLPITVVVARYLPGDLVALLLLCADDAGRGEHRLLCTGCAVGVTRG